ncbi:hypothetical protein GOP47_0007690 [Adiantum capillus-veneris]|uniref:Peroxisomal membrane protein PEX16 n=1 Tax=Adiantum capillus-veneris TaxID=13818 RepID=A0A9D4V170_ADICA|nr:hypothetical protein GOP47_0007690 [Adiantum capillus-veneris]
METYKLWVRRNQQLVASMENMATTMTWFLPERFTSSEVGTEAVAAILGLTTVLNQHIIDTAPQPFGQAVHPHGNASATVQQQRCMLLASLLSAVKQFEIFVEVTAERYKGRHKKWDTLAAMEAIKACLRFLILHQNGYRMLLSGGEAVHTEGANFQSITETFMDRASGGQSKLSSSPDIKRGHLSGNLETKASMALTKFGERAGVTSKPSWTYHLHPKTFESASRPSDMHSNGPTDISSILSLIPNKNRELSEALLVFGEWIFILRPLVYVLLIRRYGLKSWKPWVTSLGLDAAGLTTILVAAFLKDRKQLGITMDGLNCSGRPPFSTEEVQEVKRRQLLLVFYLIRDPFFSKYTRQYLGVAERALRPVPLIGSLGGKIVELFSGIQGRYCYTSGS